MAFFLKTKQLMKKIGFNMPALFGAIMVLFIFSGAIAFAFTDVMEERLFGPRRTWFVVILLVYGVYRSFRLYQSLKPLRHDQ